MARKRNEEYTGSDEDGEFEEEPVESYEDPPDFEDEVTDEGESHDTKCGSDLILIFASTPSTLDETNLIFNIEIS